MATDRAAETLRGTDGSIGTARCVACFQRFSESEGIDRVHRSCIVAACQNSEQSGDKITDLQRQLAQAKEEITELRRARIGDAEVIGRWMCQAQAAESALTTAQQDRVKDAENLDKARQREAHWKDQADKARQERYTAQQAQAALRNKVEGLAMSAVSTRAIVADHIGGAWDTTVSHGTRKLGHNPSWVKAADIQAALASPATTEATTQGQATDAMSVLPDDPNDLTVAHVFEPLRRPDDNWCQHCPHHRVHPIHAQDKPS